MKRKYYVDNLRWLCILLLVPFHCAMAWNSWGEGNYISIGSNRALSSFIIMVSPWYMPLLFVMAGMSAKYSMENRGIGKFCVERICKLFVPLVTGMLTVVAAMTYFAERFNYGYQGNFVSHYLVFFTKFTDLTGYDGGFTPAHLWFLLYLFLVSMLAVLVILLQRKFLPKLSAKKLGKVWICLLMVLPLALTPVLNIADKSIGAYMALFLIGYYVFTEEEVMNRIESMRYVTLIVTLLFDVADTYLYLFVENANSNLNYFTMVVTEWFGILTMLGWGKHCFNQNNKVFRYLSKRSFAFYIFHFLWIVIFQSYCVKATQSLFLQYVLPILGAYLMTFITCELVAHIPGVRTLFGIKK